MTKDVRDGYWTTSWLKCKFCESYAPLSSTERVTCGPNCPQWIAGIQPGGEWGYVEQEIVHRWYYRGHEITEAEYEAARVEVA